MAETGADPAGADATLEAGPSVTSPTSARAGQSAGAARIAAAFEAARAEGRAALMPYMRAGFPGRESSRAIAAAAGPSFATSPSRR